MNHLPRKYFAALCAWLAALCVACCADAPRLGAESIRTVSQTSDASAGLVAGLAMDDSVATYSSTHSIPDSHWQVELNGTYDLTRIEVVNRPSRPSAQLAGQVLRVYGMEGQAAFTVILTDPGLGGTWSVDLPASTRGRIVRIGLENGQPNGDGSYSVSLAEVRLFGYATASLGPIDLTAHATVSQSSLYGSFGAELAIDGDPATYTHTAGEQNSYWFVALDYAQEIQQIEIVNRPDVGARLEGLILRIMDDASNTVATATLTNPGDGATWSYTPPPGTTGRYVRVGLENGEQNGQPDYYVSLAEFNIFTSTNLAHNKHAYMVRYQDSLPPASNANDGNYATESKSTTASVDCYWEVDLGASFALSQVRMIAADGFAQRMSHATVRLFDEAHESIFSQHLAGLDPTFDVDIIGLRHARFVRVGFENKERSHITGGIEWYLGIKEVQVFGRPSSELGILSFDASTDRIAAGGGATLTWQIEGLDALTLYPGGDSAAPHTDGLGRGTLVVSPTNSTEYLLVGTAAHGIYTQAVAVVVDDLLLPPRISEIVTDNSLSLRDGRGDASDWIELYNPNNEPLNMSGYGLSDRIDRPMKWVFPATNMPPHGHMVVFASGRDNPVDDEGWLHADFKLDSDGESVVLTATNGSTILDAVTNYPAQMEDLAYGRTLDGELTFIEPTPLAYNIAPTYAGWLAPLKFSHKRGFYTNSFSLAITNLNTTNSTVTYSLDGTEPSLPYESSLPINGTACVRADVTREGYKSPRTKTHTYIFTADVLTSSVMNQSTVQSYETRAREGLLDLPTFSVVVPDVPNYGKTNDYVEREASVELLWPDGYDKHVQSNCGFFRFGGAWTLFAKKNYRLKFRPEYGNRKFSAPLFNGFDHGFKVVEAFDALDLRGGGHDMSSRGFYMSARFSEDSMLDMGSINPHGRFVHLYLNGTYWGQYHCRERLVDRFLADYLGGPAEDYVTVRGNDNVGSSFIPGTPDPPKHQPWQYVLDNRGNYTNQAPYVDMSHLIDFHLMWAFGNSETEYRSAGPLAVGSGFKFWIADADGYLRVTGDRTGNPGPAAIFGNLVSEGHPDFMTLLADRAYKHFFNDGAMTSARLTARLNERMDEIYNGMVDECARWGVRTPANWESAAQSVRDGMFISRPGQMVGYLRSHDYYPSFDPPTLNQHGGSVSNGFEVTLASGSGTIYYTLDGSDPRLPGGDVSPMARIYGAGGTTTNTLLPAGSIWRYWDEGSLPATNWFEVAFDDGAWPSGPAELGDGDGGEDTVIDYDRGETCYFRTEFVVSGLAGVDQLMAELLRDDGAVVYLNGDELFRDNMPDGDVEYGTRSSSRVAGNDESAFYSYALPADLLRAGPNVLAVEIHQADSDSSDIGFDLALAARSVTDSSIVITSNTVLKTRAWTGSEWSALSESQFLMADRRPVSTGDVAFSEIHCDPADGDSYEFLEILNVSTSLVDLTGAKLTDGVDFWFPNGLCLAPGEIVVVVEDAWAFSNRYQNVTSTWFYAGITVAGQWSGALADEGERVTLSASNGTAVLSVRYAADSDWPERAHGRGSSLELIDPDGVPPAEPELGGYLADGLNWQSSSLFHGSPGRIDDFARPVVINEVLAHTDAETDWVELYNRGVDSVDLSGLCMGDHYGEALRYGIPTQTVINAGEFLSFGAAELGFAFSELGSDILLVETVGTNIYRFYDTVDFPAVEREEPFGRYRKSDGIYDFTELRASTRDDTNALPRVGPVVFSEVMYHPATDSVEYVELVCITDAVVPFYDPAHPSNVWELSGAVSYTFPTGLVMNPCDVWIVCATNPDAFRAAYGVDPAVPVYGPWNGALDNAGESIKLRRPGDPEFDGTVPYYRVDRVNYRPTAPWPVSADLGNMSLERMPLEGYGNDPVCWQASAAGGTPGVANGNRLPFVSAVGTNAVDEGRSITVTVSVVDFDVPWQSVDVTTGGVPVASVFDHEAGILTWATAEPDGPGDHTIAFVGTDTACQPGVTTQELVVTVREVNAAPVMQPLTDLRYHAGLMIERLVGATDMDLPTQMLSFVAMGLPGGLSIDPLSGTISGVGDSTGTYTVIVTVADDQAPPLAATNTWSLEIAERFAVDAAFGSQQGTVLRFPMMTGETYRAEFRDSLSTGTWQTLRLISPATTNWVEVVDPDATSNSYRFYRIRWVP